MILAPPSKSKQGGKTFILAMAWCEAFICSVRCPLELMSYGTSK